MLVLFILHLEYIGVVITDMIMSLFYKIVLVLEKLLPSRVLFIGQIILGPITP